MRSKTMETRHTFPLGACLMLLAACGGGAETEAPVVLDTREVQGALSAIQADAIETHMRVLAHDSLEGRRPGTRGFEVASRYVEAQLAGLGLEPAGPNGAWRQPVPLRHSVVVAGESSMTVSSPADERELMYGADYYLGPDHLRGDVDLEGAPVAFVGYGVSAPDFGYDDYAEIDVEGKVVAYLSGGPASLPSNERAYFSRGATKQAEALSRGAVGVITFWRPDDPRFRWDNSVARASTGSFAWLDGSGTPNRGDAGLLATVSLNHSGAEALFSGADRTIVEAVSNASQDIPQAWDLASTVSMRTRTDHEQVDSWNVVARLEGSDPELADEHVVYVAHVDHFGIGVAVDGDSIYNGAHDNASGTSIVLEIARAYASLPVAPRRSILFLVVTAEEWGLLGSDYFAENPTVSRSGLVANLSLDMPFLFHPLMDVVPYGAEHSSLSESVGQATAHLGIGVGPDPIPEQVLFIRSDHFSFVQRGIPALFIKSGFETGNPAMDGSAMNAAFRSDVYHTPFDEVEQGFDFEAGAQHGRLNFLTGYIVAQETSRPSWNEGDFFGGIFGGG